MKENNLEKQNKIEELLKKWFDLEVDRYQKNEIPKILQEMKENRLSREQLTNTIKIRYQAAHFFEDMLREMIKVVRESNLETKLKSKLAKAAEINLAEELGEKEEYGGPHQEGRRVLLTALGVDYDAWESKLGNYEKIGEVNQASKNMLLKLQALVRKGPIEAISVLWYYENRISMDHINGDYHILLNTFEHKFPEFKKAAYQEGDVLWHIASHAEHDEHHANLAKDSLCVTSDLKDVVKTVNQTIEKSKEIVDRFWEEVSQYI